MFVFCCVGDAGSGTWLVPMLVLLGRIMADPVIGVLKRGHWIIRACMAMCTYGKINR